MLFVLVTLVAGFALVGVASRSGDDARARLGRGALVAGAIGVGLGALAVALGNLAFLLGGGIAIVLAGSVSLALAVSAYADRDRS